MGVVLGIFFWEVDIRMGGRVVVVGIGGRDGVGGIVIFKSS